MVLTAYTRGLRHAVAVMAAVALALAGATGFAQQARAAAPATADVVTRAMGRAVLAAESVSTSGGSWPSYRDLAPSAVAG